MSAGLLLEEELLGNVLFMASELNPWQATEFLDNFLGITIFSISASLRESRLGDGVTYATTLSK